MEKKKAIKIVTATAIAASAFTAVAPTQSEAATSLTSQIKTAKATIKKPYDTYINATKTPASLTTVKNQIAAAKKAKASINAAIKKAKLTTKQKNAKYAEIKAYDQYITRAEGYVAALSIDVVGAKAQLATAIASGNDADKLAKQNALKAKIAQFKTAVAKVYGKNTRSLLLSYYVTPAQKLVDSVVFDVKIESVSALNDTNQFLQINFSGSVKSLTTSDIEIKDAKKGDLYGAKAVTLSSDGKVATVELYTGVDKENVLQYLTDYTVTVNVNGKKVTANFNRAAFLDQRVTSVNMKDHEFTIADGKGGSETIKVLVDTPEFKDFNFEALKAEKVRVWYNKDNELLKYEIVKNTTVTDAIQVTDTNEIKLLSTGKKINTTTEKYSDDSDKFAFYLNGKPQDTVDAFGKTDIGHKNQKFNYAKIGYDKSGKIEYVSAYNLSNFIVVDHVDGNSLVGVTGLGTGGDFNAEDATIIKDGKTISKTDIKKGDVVFFYNYGDGQSKKDRFAVVQNKTVSGKIDNVYESSLTISGKIYDFNYDSTIQPSFGFGYENAVYINDSGKTDTMDSDAAKALQAGGPVTAYFDLAGNLVYVAGATATFNSNSTTGILTDAIVGDSSFSKDSIQVDAVLPTGTETIKDVKLDNLDKIKVNGTEYKIDNTSPAAGKYVARLSYDKKYLALFTTEAEGNKYADSTYSVNPDLAVNPNASAKKGAETITPVAFVDLTKTEGKVVKLALDSNNAVQRIEFFTNHANAQGTAQIDIDATSPAGSLLKAGDQYAVTNGGSKQFNPSTVVYDAKDAVKTNYDAKDITVTTWGKYNGSDIRNAEVVYNDDNEVIALVIKDSSSNTKKYEEAVVTNVQRNTDGDVVSVEGYVQGKKQTLTVDKVANNDIVKGSTAVFVFDDNNSTLVKDIYTTNHDSANKDYSNRTKGLTGLTIVATDVNVGNRTVKINGVPYKFANDGLVLNGSDRTDITVKSLTDLAGKPSITAVLDENGTGAFVKYFIYGDTTNDAIAPTGTTVTNVLGSTTVNADTYAITGAGETGSTIKVYNDVNNNGAIDAGDLKVASTTVAAGAYSVAAPLTQNAANYFVVTATDAAGNVSTPVNVVGTITEDSTAPALPTVNAVNSTATTVTGTAEAGSTVTVKAGTTVLGTVTTANGTYSVTIAAQAATTVLSVTATDVAGNVSTAATTTVQ